MAFNALSSILVNVMAEDSTDPPPYVHVTVLRPGQSGGSAPLEDAQSFIKPRKKF